MNCLDHIKTELLILIPVLYFIGSGLKKSKLPDKRIPAVPGIFAVLLSDVWILATADISDPRETASAIFTAVTQGVLVAGAGVYASRLYIQAKKRNNKCLILSKHMP